MDKKQAIRDVQQIKQVMEESHKKSNRNRLWIIVPSIILALVLSGLFPFLGPILAVGLLVGGIVTYRRTEDRLIKGIAAGVIAVGGILLVATLLVVVGNIYYGA